MATLKPDELMGNPESEWEIQWTLKSKLLLLRTNLMMDDGNDEDEKILDTS